MVVMVMMMDDYDDGWWWMIMIMTSILVETIIEKTGKTESESESRRESTPQGKEIEKEYTWVALYLREIQSAQRTFDDSHWIEADVNIFLENDQLAVVWRGNELNLALHLRQQIFHSRAVQDK